MGKPSDRPQRNSKLHGPRRDSRINRSHFVERELVCTEEVAQFSNGFRRRPAECRDIRDVCKTHLPTVVLTLLYKNSGVGLHDKASVTHRGDSKQAIFGFSRKKDAQCFCRLTDCNAS